MEGRNLTQTHPVPTAVSDRPKHRRRTPRRPLTEARARLRLLAFAERGEPVVVHLHGEREPISGTIVLVLADEATVLTSSGPRRFDIAAVRHLFPEHWDASNASNARDARERDGRARPSRGGEADGTKTNQCGRNGGAQ